MTKHYAAIGTRKLSLAQKTLCKKIGAYLAAKGCILHTGAAQGADQTYAEGAFSKRGVVHLHLPWRAYEEGWITGMSSLYGDAVQVDVLEEDDDAAFGSVTALHPAPERLSRGGMALHARNHRIISPKIIGTDEIDFVIALPSISGGGTMQGIRLARQAGISVVRLDKLTSKDARLRIDSLIYGSVAERSKAAVLKTADLQGSGGSNPSASEAYRSFQERLENLLEILPKEEQDSLKLARLRMANAAIEKGDRCPCCGKHTKVDNRKLNSTMARSLIWLVKESGPDRKWVNWQGKAHANLRRSNQLSTLKHGPEWEMVEPRPNKDASKKNSGWWRPTNRGVDFVRREIRVRQRVHTYNDTVLNFSGPKIDIKDALGSKFNYAELMATIYPG